MFHTFFIQLKKLCIFFLNSIIPCLNISSNFKKYLKYFQISREHDFEIIFALFQIKIFYFSKALRYLEEIFTSASKRSAVNLLSTIK